MKWSIFVCFFVFSLSAYCEGGALRCPPGVLDPICTEEKKEVDTQESSSVSAEVQCLVGTEWESNCHYCRCSDSGIAECLKQDVCDKGIFAEPTMCKPNTTFQRDCNTCFCLENGLGLCTLEFCRRTYPPIDIPELTEHGDTGKENTKKSEKSDLVLPVKKFLETKHVISEYAIICKPHEEFMRDCNPCKCADNGLSYSCTKNECLEVDMNKEVEVFMQSEGEDHIERQSLCRARNTFYIRCNACHCNALGTDYTCTNKPCPLPADVELFYDIKITESSKNSTKTQVCIANRMFVKDCNTCWCNGDGTGYFCTRKVCVPLLPDEEPDFGGIPAEELHVAKKKCQPDEVFEMDCNMCRCNPDGMSYACTRRACEKAEDKENLTLSRKVRSFTTSETQKACQPGQEFRLDCNQCLCDNRGLAFSCTRNDCSSLNNHHATKREVSEPIEMKCVAGSVFDRDCNVCRCTEDGSHATCTIKRCLQKNELDTDVNLNDPGFRCNPGEQFKRDCKDCTCSADGKSVFCTLRLCDQDLADDIQTQSN